MAGGVKKYYETEMKSMLRGGGAQTKIWWDTRKTLANKGERHVFLHPVARFGKAGAANSVQEHTFTQGIYGIFNPASTHPRSAALAIPDFALGIPCF